MSNKRLTHEDILNAIIELTEKVKPEFLEEGFLPIKILVDLLHDGQDSLPEQVWANLIALASLLLKKVKIPAARYVDGEGNKLWTLEQLAAYLDKPLAELEKDVADFVIKKPEQLHPLQ